MNILELSAILDAGILAECSRVDTKRRITVEPTTFGRARLGIGPKSPVIIEGVYDDVWDFLSWRSALQAMETWNPEKDSEPDGWNRHYFTQRYRINGDKNLEWVKDDNDLSIEQNIISAVRSAKGQYCLIDGIMENSLHIGSEMPAYTQCFTVASNGVVQWIVYHYCDRSVVLTIDEMKTTSVANVVQRLKDEA